MLTNWEKTFPGQIIKYNNKKYVFICIEDSNMIKIQDVNSLKEYIVESSDCIPLSDLGDETG